MSLYRIFLSFLLISFVLINNPFPALAGVCGDGVRDFPSEGCDCGPGNGTDCACTAAGKACTSATNPTPCQEVTATKVPPNCTNPFPSPSPSPSPTPPPTPYPSPYPSPSPAPNPTTCGCVINGYPHNCNYNPPEPPFTSCMEKCQAGM